MNTFSEEVNSTPCQVKLQILDFKTLNLEDCKMAGALVNNSEMKKYQQEKIYKKLSVNLARQIDQGIEEMATLDQFYESNGQKLGENADIKKNCRVDIFDSLENKCPGVKLNFLKQALKINGGSVKDHLSLKFKKVSFGVKDNNQQCPIEDASGLFKLNSQLDNDSAMKFIELIKDKNANSEVYQQFINQYPQFKLVEKTNNTEFIKSFKNYISSFQGHKNNAADFIAKFFSDKKNNDILGAGFADQCRKINSNTQKFLCNNLDQLGSLDGEVSNELFGLDPEINLKENKRPLPDVTTEKGENFYSAYGFLCLARENKADKKVLPQNSVDDWYKLFNQNTRPVSEEKSINISKDLFCKTYNCQENSIKESAPSCKNGGPVTSSDLKTQFGCPDSEICKSDIQKKILFIESIEKQDKLNKEADAYEQRRRERGTNPNSNEPEAERPRRLSTFAENFLGVEGSLIAEGKKVTPATIAEKTEEFKERNLDPSPAVVSETKPTQLAKNEQPAAAPVVPVATSIAPEVNDGKNINIKTAQLAQEQDSIAPVKRSRRSSNASSSSSTYRSDDSSSSSSQSNNNDDEIKKMRAEMEDLAKSMKAPSVDAQNIAAIAEANSRYMPKAKTTISGSSASEEREKNLNSWESRLREREGDLFDRETRAPSSFSESGNTFKKSEASENSAKASKTNDGAIQLSSSDKEKDKKSGSGGASKSDGKGSATGTDSAETVISSEELANMKADSLAKLATGPDRTFLMKIRHKQKFYNVTVKKLMYQGNEILVPLLNESNSSLAKIILDSPLFSEYKKIQFSSRLSNK